MSIETELKTLSFQVSNLTKLVQFLVSEKSLNEDPGYARAMAEAKKGNVKALREYSIRRAKAKGLS